MLIGKTTPAPSLSTIKPQTPLPCINPQIVVRASTLYLYGGILKVGDREVILNNCWSLDLQKQNEWVCIWDGMMHKQVWKGVEIVVYVSSRSLYPRYSTDSSIVLCMVRMGVSIQCKVLMVLLTIVPNHV